MLQNKYTPKTLIQYYRGGFINGQSLSYLVEQEHFGFVLGTNFKIGEPYNYPFYLRSCAKPLQASLAIDNDLDLTEEELAICCASHTGEVCHVELAKKLLNKIGISEDKLKCGFHKPISKTEKEKLILFNQKENVFQNNCVGKHIMMLALCKKNNWDIETYDEMNHPLQQKIKEKIYELCEIEDKIYPITKDGCGVPIHSMPLENILKGYLNLFTSEKYKKIAQAYRNYPYIIGGEDRTDTKIIQNSNNLIAKVGAGGLCTVINLEKKEGFIVKILDCDMKAREITVLSILKRLKWADIWFDDDIKTLHDEIIGKIKFVGFE
ncbi:MAG: asparaginase [Candidatus Gastranaerophilaceae bacterium]